MLIEITNLNCYNETKQPVISDASFCIYANDRVAILSQDQEPATILCHAMAGILARTHPAYSLHGSITYKERPIESFEPHERVHHITYVPPTSELLISGVKETVFDEIALSLELYGTEPAVIRTRVERILHHLGIGHLANRNPDELSGGERHKVALASVIITEPDVLILDNPTLFLDARGVSNLFHILHRYSGTVVFSDNNPYLWTPLANRFIIIHENSVYSLESPDQLLGKLLNGELNNEVPAWVDLYRHISHATGNEKTLRSFRCIATIRSLRELLT